MVGADLVTIHTRNNVDAVQSSDACTVPVDLGDFNDTTLYITQLPGDYVGPTEVENWTLEKNYKWG